MASRAKHELLAENINLIKENIDMQNEVLQIKRKRDWDKIRIDSLDTGLSRANKRNRQLAKQGRLYKIGFWVSAWIITLILLLIK